MSVIPSSDSVVPEKPTSEDSSPRLVPGLWFWCWIAFAVVAIAILQIPVLQENVWGAVAGPDNAIANLITQALIVVTYLTLTIWLLVVSSHGWAVRLAPVALLMVLLVLFKPGRPTGEMWFPWSPRWIAEPEELAAPDGPGIDDKGNPMKPAKPVEKSLPPLDPLGPTDFPEFLGAGRQANVTSVKLARDWEATPPQEVARWKVGAGWSGFAVIGDRAVTMEQRGDTEFVTCYNWRTGELLWSQGNRGRHDNAMGGIGPRSVPTITADGQVFALGATGWLYALDVATGSEQWKRQILYEAGTEKGADEHFVMWGRSASPLVVDDLVVVPLGGVKDKRSSLVAYERQTAKERWRSGDRNVGYSSPILTTLCGVRQIVSVNEDNVSGHDPVKGSLLWELDFPGSSTAAANVSQPRILPGDKLLLSKGYSIGASCYQVKHQGGEWSFDPIWGTEGRKVLKTKFTNLVIHNNHAFGLDDGTLQCVDLETGEMKWKKGRYGQGQILGAGDLILVQSENGPVFLVEANTEEHVELGKLDALSSQTWNNPALAGEYLLVRNAKEAAVYKLPVEK